MRSFGVVKWFGGINKNTNRENKFGFISDQSGVDVFLHKDEWKGSQQPDVDGAVFYNFEKDKGKWKATDANSVSSDNLTLLDLDIALLGILDSKELSPENHKKLDNNIRSSFRQRYSTATTDELTLFLENNNNHEIWRSLSKGTVWTEGLYKLNRMNLVSPLDKIPWELLSTNFFLENEEEVSEYLSKLEIDTAKNTVLEFLLKLPISLILFLVIKNILSTENELGIRHAELSKYLALMISKGVNNHPEYVNNIIKSEVETKGSLRNNPILLKIIDDVLFKKYLFEKNIKFLTLYENSTYLKSRFDFFILHGIFSLVSAQNSTEIIYQVFLGRLWEAITSKSIDPIAQQKELQSLFPSCRTMPSPLFCEAVYWEKNELFLCRGSLCKTPQIEPDLTKDYLDFSIYDWFSHYGIDYFNEKKPSTKDFPIKLAGYFNRLTEIYDVIHCRCCKSLMLPDMRYSRVEHTVIENGQSVKRDMAASYRLTVFKCPNSSCEEFDKGYYINHCVGHGCYEIIDTRDLRIKCDSGLYVCKGCGSCCGDHAKTNPVGLCPDCGSPLKLYEYVREASKQRQNRFVQCSSSHCDFTIMGAQVPKKFYMKSCGPTIKVET